MLRSHVAGAASLIIGLSAVSVQAQRNNASDVTGAPITSGAIVGGKLMPIRTAAAVRTAASILRAELSRGALAGSGGVPIANSARTLLTSLVTGNQSAVAQFSAGFSNSGAPPASITALSNSLFGLVNSPTAQQIVTAMQAWNAVVRAASASFLENPSAEFLATAALMSSYSSALRAQGAAR